MTSPNGSNQSNPVLAENHRMRGEIMRLRAENQKQAEEILTLRRERDDAAERMDEKDKQDLSERWGEGD